MSKLWWKGSLVKTITNTGVTVAQNGVSAHVIEAEEDVLAPGRILGIAIGKQHFNSRRHRKRKERRRRRRSSSSESSSNSSESSGSSRSDRRSDLKLSIDGDRIARRIDETRNLPIAAARYYYNGYA